ncbi:hypothetical protein NIA69_19860 [Gemmiger formicilis]|nr:hypothetical protein [Gemmiger formicilis]
MEQADQPLLHGIVKIEAGAVHSAAPLRMAGIMRAISAASAFSSPAVRGRADPDRVKA